MLDAAIVPSAPVVPCTTIVSPAFKSLSAASTLFVTFDDDDVATFTVEPSLVVM